MIRRASSEPAPRVTTDDSLGIPSGPWPQYLNTVLGLWLVVSASAWPHTVASRMNTLATGVFIVVIALWAVVRPHVHRLNAAAATWLIISSVWIHHLSNGTAWNNIIAALLVLGFAVATNEEFLAHSPRTHRHA